MYAAVKDIVAFLEQLAPRALAESWDNTGLAVGDPQQEVRRVLIALDVLDSVIAEAVEKKADLIVTHHPMLLFRKIQSITKDDVLGGRIYRLIQNNVAALSAHTNLDIVAGGVNDVLAETLGITEVELLEETQAEALKKLVVYVPLTHMEEVRQAICQAGGGHIGGYADCTFYTKGEGTFLPMAGTKPYIGMPGTAERVEEARLETIVPQSRLADVIAAMCQAHPYEEVAYDVYSVEQKGKREGIGRIGRLQEPMTLQAFAAVLTQRLGVAGVLRLVGDPQKEIRRVALCGGSGAEYIAVAAKKGADLYITGDLKYHEAQKALEMGLCVADVTHYASEAVVLPVLERLLKKAAAENGWELDVVCSEVDGQTFWSI